MVICHYGDTLFHDEALLPEGAIVGVVASERLGELFDPTSTL